MTVRNNEPVEREPLLGASFTCSPGNTPGEGCPGLDATPPVHSCSRSSIKANVTLLAGFSGYKCVHRSRGRQVCQQRDRHEQTVGTHSPR